MMATTEESIKTLGRKIITDYDRFRKDQLIRDSVITSAGFLISAMKQYELEEGQYGERSITVLPSCSPIIDLSLIYNTDQGLARYILTIRPDQGTSYTIFSNKLYYINADDRDRVFARADFTTTTKYQKKKVRNLTPIKTIVSKKEKTTRSTLNTSRTVSETVFSSDGIPTQFCCLYNHRNCCYIKSDHIEPCKTCCLGKEHHAPS